MCRIKLWSNGLFQTGGFQMQGLRLALVGFGCLFNFHEGFPKLGNQTYTPPQPFPPRFFFAVLSNVNRIVGYIYNTSKNCKTFAMAGGFTEAAFIKKLSDLNNSSQSIQTLSLWLIHHRKHYSTVVKIWTRELIKAPKDSKKLTFMYLANDVIQNSRKKGPEYGNEFGHAMRKVFEHMSKSEEKMKNSLDRLLVIWGQRGVYDGVQISEFKRSLLLGKDAGPPSSKKSKSHEKRNKSPPARRIPESEVTVEVMDGETHVHLCPYTPARDPPEPDELIKAIKDLELNIASSDETVRKRIAQLPPEVSEVSHLSKIENKEAADKLSVEVKEAVSLLTHYNSRLSVEMGHRKKVAIMMKEFLHSQEELLTQAEQNLEDYQEKLLKVYNVRQELHSHIKNLPDLTQLPNVTDGLAPLPSAENLFMQ